jgi:hypothetical protein
MPRNVAERVVWFHFKMRSGGRLLGPHGSVLRNLGRHLLVGMG